MMRMAGPGTGLVGLYCTVHGHLCRGRCSTIAERLSESSCRGVWQGSHKKSSEWPLGAILWARLASIDFRGKCRSRRERLNEVGLVEQFAGIAVGFEVDPFLLNPNQTI